MEKFRCELSIIDGVIAAIEIEAKNEFYAKKIAETILQNSFKEGWVRVTVVKEQ